MRQMAPDLMATLTHSVLVLKNEKYNDIQGRGLVPRENKSTHA